MKKLIQEIRKKEEKYVGEEGRKDGKEKNWERSKGNMGGG